MQPTELYRNHWCVVIRDPSEPFARFVRNSEPLTNLADLERVQTGLIGAIAARDRRTMGLLIDMREAPMRGDAEFNAKVRETFSEWTRAFKRQAVLVRTAVGKLQATRTSRDAGNPGAEVFTDEAEAIAFLRAP